MTYVLLGPGLGKLVYLAVNYLRSTFNSGDLTVYGANTFAAALRRYLLLASSCGYFIPDVRAIMRPIWRVVRSCNLALPPEFRAPVPARVALALAAWGWTTGRVRFAIMTLLAHHCLLRPEEARSTLLGDIILFLDPDGPRCPGVFGLVGVRKPKTRRNPAHALEQHVLIEDPCLATGLRLLLDRVPPAARSQPLWLGTPAQHLTCWHKGLAALGIADSALVPAGLRGGGATEHYLQNRDVFELRRRGRWTQLATLDRYLQEGVLLLSSRTQTSSTVNELAALMGPLLISDASPPPPLHLANS